MFQERSFGFSSSAESEEIHGYNREVIALLVIVTLLVLCCMCTTLCQWTAEQRAKVIRGQTMRMMTAQDEHPAAVILKL